MQVTIFADPRAIAFAGAFIVSTLLLGGAAGAQQKLTLATLGTPNTTGERAAYVFAETVEKLSDGKITVTPNPSLFKGNELAPSVRDGRVEMAMGIYGYLSGSEPRMGLANLPGLIPSAEEFWPVYDSFFGSAIAEIWDEQFNVVSLSTGLWEPNLIYTTRPVHEVGDFKGLKIRVSNTESAKFMNEIGAVPTPLNVSELAAALERGILDGFSTSLCYAYHQEFWRVAKYVSDWGLASTQIWAVLINKDFFEGMSPEDQETLRAAGDATAKQMRAEFDGFNAACVEGFKAAGAEYYVADEAARAALYAEKNTKPVFDDWLSRAKEKGIDGEEFLARTRSALGQ